MSLKYILKHGGFVIYLQQEGRGIGLAAAAALADAGAHVTLVARSKTEIEAAARAITARGQSAVAHRQTASGLRVCQ